LYLVSFNTQALPMPTPAPRPLILRLTLSHPPAGVSFAVQLGRDSLLPPTRVTRESILFDVPVELVVIASGSARLRGAAIQGPASGRFLYVTSGTRAGDIGSPWNRRAKVPLNSLPAELFRAQTAERSTILSAEIAGSAKDGGPAVASVPLLRGWNLVTTAE
jgi:hypothetical protein